MKKPELLAPVGDLKSLIAAVMAGCDAVYLSGKLYGARKYADNFDDLQLIEAIKYCHLYGVKVYVTVNTLIYESEVENFIKYVEFLHKNNVDAIIIQDIGMFDLIHKIYPNLEIHISTQMNIHNLEGTKLFETLGASRVVLAREMSIEQIKQVKKKCNIELEVFVHGALCICYSGQCLMSSLIGGRSGNRGTCAQCCRQPYDLYSNGNKINIKNYLLSTKDLNTLHNINQLIDCGVDSFKIEGRMKSPEYVYYVVSLYRKAIDSYIETGKINISFEEIENLKKIFNREFTKGFIFSEENDNFTNEYRPNHLGVEVGRVLSSGKGFVEIKLTSTLNINDGIRILDSKDTGKIVDKIFLKKELVKKATSGNIVRIPYKYKVGLDSVVIKTTDYELLSNIDKQIKNNHRQIPLKFVLSAKINNNLELLVIDKDYKFISKSDYIVQESNKYPTTNDNIINQLSKLGNTVFYASDIKLEIDDNIFIPIKKLNEIRRNAIDNIISNRLYNIPFKKSKYYIKLPDFDVENIKTIYVKTLQEYSKIKDMDYNQIYVDINIFDKINDSRAILKLPRIQETLKERNSKLLIGEYGSLYKYKHNDITTDFSFNIVNSYSVAFLHSLGVKKVTLSYELNDYQINKIVESYKDRYHKNPCLEVIVSGKIESMVTKYKLLQKYKITNGENYLLDKYNNRFLVEEKDNCTYIYHYLPKKVDNKTKYFSLGVSSIRDSY